MRLPHAGVQVVRRALLWWARAVPFHRGKQRLAETLVSRLALADHGERVVRRQGARWSLDPADYVCRDLYWAGAKDVAQLRALRQHVPSGGVMFDVGASFGYYAISMARHLRQACVVHAFEPDDKSAARLAANLALNSIHCVHLHRVGVWDRTGSAAMRSVPGNSGASSLRPGGGIPLLSIDGFCRDHAITRLDAMKIDVEGAELHVLRGAADALDRYRPTLLVELNAAALQRQEATIDEVLARLADHRYGVAPVARKHRGRDLRRLRDDIIDVLCVPREAG